MFDDFGFGFGAGGNIDSVFGEDNGVHEFGSSFFSERKLIWLYLSNFLSLGFNFFFFKIILVHTNNDGTGGGQTCRTIRKQEGNTIITHTECH